MRTSILLLLLMSFIFKGDDAIAQDTIPRGYLTNMPEYYQEYLQHDIPGDLVENYAQQFAYSKFNHTFYHKIYYSQPLLEDYIRSILKRLLPKKEEITELEIYITKSTKFNAFTISDGSIFVNIAALAKMSTEAELAFLLAHEYAHYALEHGILSYKKKYVKEDKKKRKERKKQEKKSRKERRKNPGLSDIDKYYSFSQKNEMASDSLALVLGTAAGYDARAIDLLLQKLIFLQKKSFLRFNESYNSDLLFPTSHPIGEDRVLKLKSVTTSNDGGSLNILGEERFEKVKKLAEYEFLKLLDEDFDLHQAITFPLKKYLLSGEDIYLPTLVRSIRKLMMLLPEIKDKGFMITHFNNYEERFGKDENILHHLHLEYPDSNEVAKMESKNAIDLEKVPFYTYKEAFNYFTKKAIAAGFAEPHLDVALYYGVKSSKGRGSLKRYLSNSDNLYHEYATLLKKGKLLENMEGRDKVLLIGGISNFEFKKKKLKTQRIKDYKDRNILLAGLRNKYLDDSLHYKVYNYIDFYQNSPLGPHLRTLERLVFSGRSDLLLTYDPRLYYAFRKANVNSLEYMSILHLNYKNQFWRILSGMIPPYTLSTTLALLTRSVAYASHINAMRYYGCYVYNEEVYGKTYSDLKRGKMSTERAVKKMYKMHREQKTFLREWYLFNWWHVANVKDRTEWRY